VCPKPAPPARTRKRGKKTSQVDKSRASQNGLSGRTPARHDASKRRSGTSGSAAVAHAPASRGGRGRRTRPRTCSVRGSHVTRKDGAVARGGVPNLNAVFVDTFPPCAA